MRKLILEEWISVDGHVADRHNRLDFFAPLVRELYADSERTAFLQGIDCILFGRKTYQQFAALWPERGVENPLAKMINQTPKVVFSDTLTSAPWGEYATAQVIPGNANEAIRKLKNLLGKNIIVWGSVSLAQSLMKENQVDEYHLHLCPSLTMGGRKLFTEAATPATLNLIESRRGKGGTVLLKYQPEFVSNE
jgi:dihydrofolate reductase